MKEVILGSICCEMSNVLNCTIMLERKVEAEGQVRKRMLSSFGAFQIRQFEWGRCSFFSLLPLMLYLSL